MPDRYEKFMSDAVGTGKFYMTDPADPTVDASDDLVFTRVIFVYHEDWLTVAQHGALETLYRQKGLTVHFRDPNFATTHWFQERMKRSLSPSPSSKP